MILRKEDEQLLRISAGCSEGPVIGEVSEIYLKSKGDYIRSIKTWSRSIATKHAWRKYRHSFSAGMRKFYRSMKGRSSHRILANQIKQVYHSTKEGYKPEVNEYDNYHLLMRLTFLESLLLKEAATFKLEEAQGEFAAIAEMILEASAEMKNSILKNQPLKEESMELVLCMIGEEGLIQGCDLGKGSPILESEGYCDFLFNPVDERKSKSTQ